MLEAIHKNTGVVVSAFKIRTDLEWQGREKDEFIAPQWTGDWEKYYIDTGKTEVEVSFVKRHKRNESTENEQIVSEHFRIKNEGAKIYCYPESEEHILAKEKIYENVDEIIISNFDNKKISELTEISDVTIEKGLTQKRADVLVKFKDRHPELGRGIAFEVQISPQNSYQTIERSFDRAADGYSVVWLWSRDLPNFNKIVKVIPIELALKEFKMQVLSNENKRYNEIAEKARIKSQEISDNLYKPIEDVEKEIDKVKCELREVKSEKLKLIEELSEVNRKINELKNSKFDEIKVVLDDIGRKIVDENKDDLIQKVKERLEERDISNQISSELSKKIDGLNISGYVIDKKRICPKCSGKLHEYKNGDLACFDCPYHKLKEGYYGN